ncbi:B3 domain-containing transcription repressor VAL1 isoform X1 [Punica granatum]|uniref:B3 domain-containing transcription repressor VAL1 isoform X1 n=3 Tax=Punica granatum TaxID=22663 RepID=A0A218W1B8_PUNGR|nr:B3 domain-containing transcription repressor VAL1 isoform X1 [Punica granatum]XP_031387764.1 B3 domain-containing transcription repressor VAL1 isoform X1 [Punica granatum]OWM66634.1 hypothetical protein CDL15_Pgr010285 [Punica granatum]
MEPKICVNASCRTTSVHEWRKGWPLESGKFVDLCDQCGSAYDKCVFCETFHLEESGWRECNYCDKRIHCGCIVSRSFFELMDYGGIRCTGCPKSAQLHTPPSTRDRGEDEDKSVHLYKFTASGENHFSPQPRNSEPRSLSIKVNQELVHLMGETGINLSNVVCPSMDILSEEDHIRLLENLKDFNKSLTHSSINISLGDLVGGANLAVPFPTSQQEGSEPNTGPSSFQQGASSHPILPSLSKPGSAAGAGASKLTVPQVRVARPPAEGRGKNQLLPRYWPRITDQELEQLSGDLNSTIVPLFEKVLSASDAGRIGRLVLPKACAEAYFPPISQSEGVPVRIQDVKGNEWTFQFRFWPNNNSRMYVLEGVTPCIQSMQLCAGDTVIFSRINPGGKLVMGFRKASHSMQPQANGTSSVTPSRVVMENIPVVGGYADLLHPPNGTKDPLPNSPFENLKDTRGNVSWHRNGDIVNRTSEDATQLPPISEKKRTRNIGLKSRRLLMHNEDVMELRLTWEEAQDLLRPPPSVGPSIVTIEGHDFEEYDEPPVFGKRTVYISRSSGDQEQWAQCDDCSKWRRLPIDVLLPPKWACTDNIWDSERRFCSAPDEMTPKELDGLLRISRDTKKRRLVDNQNGIGGSVDNETAGLDALASAAELGESMVVPLGPGEASMGPTTKHPRHRAGCTCIVCIQPPSGKGKHRPTCTCNVCMTVKRRFKTLMLRKKKQRQESEHEQQADAASTSMHRDSGSQQQMNVASSLVEKSEERQAGVAAAENGSSNGQIDLNCDPDREEVEGFDNEAQKRHVNNVNSVTASGTCFPASCDYPTRTTTSSSFQQEEQQQLLDNEKQHFVQPNEEAVVSIGQKGKSSDGDGHSDDQEAADDEEPPPRPPVDI